MSVSTETTAFRGHPRQFLPQLTAIATLIGGNFHWSPRQFAANANSPQLQQPRKEISTKSGGMPRGPQEGTACGVPVQALLVFTTEMNQSDVPGIQTWNLGKAVGPQGSKK